MRRASQTEREDCDLAVIGAGAAGLTAAVFAAEAAGPGLRIVLIEGARKPGAKILVSGGGRCNVTNDIVTEKDYWGGSPHTIRNVLRAFSNTETIAWFRGLGVPLKKESSGKLFPTTDTAQTVLSALLDRVEALNVELVTGTRVTGLRPEGSGFVIEAETGSGRPRGIFARRVVVATGGLALPKSGSDGAGLDFMRALGHTIVPTTPALTPLVLRRGPGIGGRFAEFSGVTIDARLRLCRGSETRPLIEREGSIVFTHFGVSGPAAMDLSRHWLRAGLEDPATPLRVFLGVPALKTVGDADTWLRHTAESHPRRLTSTILEELLPSRIAQALAAKIGERVTLSQLPRDERRRLAMQLVDMPLDIKGTRGYTHAEATAGGVDLRDIDWRTMESRRVPGLHLCGEILDVDGRIGGFNFQWAWSSGYVAGRAVAAALQNG